MRSSTRNIGFAWSGIPAAIAAAFNGRPEYRQQHQVAAADDAHNLSVLDNRHRTDTAANELLFQLINTQVW
jgi:hypothetical protein